VVTPDADLPVCGPRQFNDPVPLKPISLKKQRRRATRFRGTTRWKEMSQLAAMLWKLAKEKTAKADAMERQGRSARRAVKLKRQARAHLHESVALLEQVLQEAPKFYLARLRLAYYMRHLQPKRAVPHFKALIVHPRALANSLVHRMELARLLVENAKPYAALRTLIRLNPTGACVALKTAAFWKLGRYDRAANALWKAAVAPSAKADAEAARAVRLVWPRVLALTSAPQRKIKHWIKSGPTWWRAQAADQVKKLAAALIHLGRPLAAHRTLKAARISGRPVSGPTSAAQCIRHLGRAAAYCLKHHARSHLPSGKPPPPLQLKLTCKTRCRNDGRCTSRADLGKPALKNAASCICRALSACRPAGGSSSRRCVYRVNSPLTVRIKTPPPGRR
jgi:tetratricopeptide (TPR) repeat protein